MKINAQELMELRLKGWTQKRIAARFGCHKSAVSNYLRRTRTRTNHPKPAKLCGCGCGVPTKRKKYASMECYMRAVCQRPHISWRHGRRIARHVVSQVFPLEPQHVVHHVDGDNRNNSLSNLWVFACHGDHMSHHRGGITRKPIWRGVDPERLAVVEAMLCA